MKHLAMISAILIMTQGVPAAAQTIHPVKITAADPDALKTSDSKEITRNGNTMSSREMGASADRKFTSGMFEAGASKFDSQSYPHDEFMFFTKGSVTLTSADGTVTTLQAGDAVFLPKAWKGVWETPGYTKFYVIYDEAPRSN